MLRRRIYQAIARQLRDSLPGLQFIDLQKGQVARAAESYPLPLPAALVEFREVTWSNTGGPQLGNAVVGIHLYVEHVSDTFEGGEQHGEAVKDLDIQDEVFSALHGFATNDMSPLKRVADAPPVYADRYVAYRVDFECTIFQERSGETMSAPKPNVNIKLKENE